MSYNFDEGDEDTAELEKLLELDSTPSANALAGDDVREGGLAPEVRRDFGKQRGINNLLAALSQAGAQMATVGGKAPPAGTEFYKSQNQELTGLEKGLAEGEAQRVKALLARAKMQQEAAKAAETQAYREKVLAAKQEENKARLAQTAEDRAYRKQTQEQARQDRLQAAKDKTPPAEKEFKTLPPERREEIDSLAKQNAKKYSIKSQIDSYLDEFVAAKDPTDKVRIGRQMLKVVNSTEGADAIGVEESKRLGAALEYQIANFFGPGPAFGRDLEGFERQVKATSSSIGSSISKNEQRIDQLYGRQPKIVPAKLSTPSSQKDVNTMTKEELLRELQDGG